MSDESKSRQHRATSSRWAIFATFVTASALLTACAPVTPVAGDGQAGTTSASPTSAETSPSEPTIAVIGDFGSGDENERAVADLVAAHSPAAVVTVGDNVYSNAGYDAQVGDFYGAYVDAATFFPATGNHDYSEGIENFDAYFAYLGGERTYVVSRGSIDFFVVDGDAARAKETRKATREWLRSAVANSTAAFAVVAVHYPPFSSGDKHGSTPELQWDFAGMGVDMVIAGHDHIYERLEVGDVTYVVNGSGGKDLYSCVTPLVEGSVICDDRHFGALFLTATGDDLQAQMVATSGELIDEFALPARR